MDSQILSLYAKYMRTVCQAPTEEAALMGMDTFAGACDDKYSQISKSWSAHWENLNTYYVLRLSA